MNERDVKIMLSRAVKGAWPNVAKASELPFPEYWKGVTEYLTFHAPRLGEGFMRQLILVYVRGAKDAESNGDVPKTPVVPDAVRAIWRHRPIVERPLPLERKDGASPEPQSGVVFGAPFGGAKIIYRQKDLL